MKKNVLSCFVLALFIASSNSCKKDSNDSKTKVYKEDFIEVYNLQSRGWVFKDNSFPYGAGWSQGVTGADKSGRPGFVAYNHKNEEDEYAYVGYLPWGSDPIPISTWMISPVYEIKNGDKLIFYTRSAEVSGYVDRLQVRLNETDNTSDVGTTATSVGKFTLLLKDINEASTANGYPITWTKYEITVAGLNGTKQSRVAFRYLVDGSKSSAIGVDAFSVTSF
jgi:hypothetical protein